MQRYLLKEVGDEVIGRIPPHALLESRRKEKKKEKEKKEGVINIQERYIVTAVIA